LEARGLRAKRHFGQNFLADTSIARRIAELCVPDEEHAVTEIGAGTGALTAPLLERARRVVAIERDRDLVPLLNERFAASIQSARLFVEEADAKTVDLFYRHDPASAKLVLAGNLPYQLTGPLLRRACGLSASMARAVFLVQLEVAERLTARPGTPEYGALSVFVQNQFEPRRAFVVRPGAFYPQPSVDSALMVLAPRPASLGRDTPRFRELVKAAFQQRRKTLRNSWRRLSGVDPERLEQAAKLAGVALDFRGERLGVEDFSRMAEALEAS
jgi:16S rRNA (adenine1518-N6/adenine1519-N6)-dimethyltransferase